ncbi:hypothetical protein [Effusibacillus lacus]|uniref:Uncharacterized protein n=1 Tax=Effusibacillus lacus TaxID=1348429 RepID=A0A292YN42_9BACL|nr:hypothetical protein [Effusibacillus lacus]TCS72027.1 hypothetical protein EDD64_12321 [Effusibacillus lacus]GAX90319.1 hypothetical protein EFBL_1945 [Effusibacillus lacus]
MMRCPNCNCRDIGKIGTNQYYCWDCFVEFSLIGDEVKLYQVEEDGSLVSFSDLQAMEQEIQQIG